MIVELQIEDNMGARITEISNCELTYMSKFFSFEYSDLQGREIGWFEVTCEINLEENEKLKIFKFLHKYCNIKILSGFDVIELKDAYISELQGDTIEIKGRIYNN